MNGFIKTFHDFKRPAVTTLASSLVSAFLFHRFLLSGFVGVDTELAATGSDNFDELGRVGLSLILKALRLRGARFDVGAAASLTFVLIILAPVLFSFLLFLADPEGGRSCYVALGAFLFSSPFWTAQFYFLNQSAAVVFSIILTAVAGILHFFGYKSLVERKIVPCALFTAFGVLLLGVSFSAYQMNAVCHAAVAACLCLLLLSSDEKSRIVPLFSFHAAAYALGVALWLFLSLCVAKGSGQDYFSGMISWGRVAPKESLSGALYSLRDTLCLPFLRIYVPVCVLFLSVLALFLIAKRTAPGRWAFLFLSGVFIALSPTSAFFIFGGDVFPRMKYPFSVSLALMLFLSCRLSRNLSRLRGWKSGAAALFLGIILLSLPGFLDLLNFSTRMYESELTVFECDKAIAADVRRELFTFLSESPEGGRNLLFVGSAAQPSVPVRYGYPGTSFFGPELLGGRNRIPRFMDAVSLPLPEGFDLPYVSDGARAAVEFYLGDLIDAMPSWPQQGFVSELFDEEAGISYVVVKLSDDWRTFGY